MKEEGFLKKAYYLLLIIVYTTGYFIYAVAQGLWSLIKRDK
tara:strand:+ start:60136 stop:60258 length:123 start_codon:yes stop_codon:yes gene_type:complete